MMTMTGYQRQRVSIKKHKDSNAPVPKDSDTLKSFLSKVAFKSNLRKKLARTELVLIVKVSFKTREIAKVFMTHVQDFF